jgi:hypothetical protein
MFKLVFLDDVYIALLVQSTVFKSSFCRLIILGILKIMLVTETF